MIKNPSKSAGFTLLELMVVMAIISIMSATTVIGFNRFSESVQVRETAGLLKDRLQALELEVLEGDYEDNTVHFLRNYLVIESELPNASLSLDFSLTACAGDPGFNISTTEPVQLSRQNEFGETLDLSTYSSDVAICPDFTNQDEPSLEYSLFNNTQWSNKLRFMHFNVQGLDSAQPVSLVDEAIRLEINGPYAKKTVYRSDSEELGPVELTLESEQGDSATVLLKE